MATSKIVKIGAVVNPTDFGRSFAAASGRIGELAQQGLAFKGFPVKKDMAEKVASAIDTGIQLHYAEQCKANGANRYVKTEKGYVSAADWQRRNKSSALPATVDIPVEKALSFSRVQLDTLKQTDAQLQAAYVAIRIKVSTYVAGQWARMRHAVAMLKNDRTGGKRGARGATKLFRDAVYSWADGLVKKAKLAKDRGDGTAPDPVKLAAAIAAFKAAIVEACK